MEIVTWCATIEVMRYILGFFFFFSSDEAALPLKQSELTETISSLLGNKSTLPEILCNTLTLTKTLCTAGRVHIKKGNSAFGRITSAPQLCFLIFFYLFLSLDIMIFLVAMGLQQYLFDHSVCGLKFLAVSVNYYMYYFSQSFFFKSIPLGSYSFHQVCSLMIHFNAFFPFAICGDMVCELKSKEFDSLTLFSLFLFIAFFFVGKFSLQSEDILPNCMILSLIRQQFLIKILSSLIYGTVEQENKCCLLMEVFI